MKFFFDHCLSFKVAHALATIFDEDEFVPLSKKFKDDAPDSQWIIELGKEGGWIVLTDDRIWRNREQKRLLVESNLVVFSTPKEKRKPGLHDRAGHLIAMWGALRQTASEARPGTWFKMPPVLSREYKFTRIN